MAYELTWLADVLRDAGCKVEEVAGWENRGRGKMGQVRGVLAHHTGAGSTGGLIALIRDGRSDLPGPLSQLYLDDDGTFFVIAAGRCNHAGKGKWQGVSNGNTQFIGIEAKNRGDGTDIWEEAQMEAYARGTAAILKHLGEDSVMVAGHKEFALPKGRKIDPSFDMVALRQRVDNIMTLGVDQVPTNTAPIATVDPQRSMLRKGDQGPSVKELQKLLGITADGAFGPKTEAAVKAFQIRKGLVGDGLVGPKTWSVLLKK